MPTEKIEIVTNKERFFIEYLILKKPLIEMMLSRINRKKTRLTETHIKILSQLLYYNDKYSELSDTERWILVFSRETKKEICQRLGMKDHILNQYLYQMRNIGLLEKDRVRQRFIIYASEDVELSYHFKFNGHQSS